MTLKQIFQRSRDLGNDLLFTLSDPSTRQKTQVIAGMSVLVLILILLLLTVWWDQTPDLFDPKQHAADNIQANEHTLVTGYTSTATLINLVNMLLNKSGGYLSNDVMPPSIWMDNMPNWEFGVLVQVRDFSRTLRNDISRSQSQSLENTDLAIAEPQFNFSNDSWLFPATETEYRKGVRALDSYLAHLSNSEQHEAQFYARADNLTDWLAIVEKRLGSLSQRLSASVGQVRINTDLAGDPVADQSTPVATEIVSKTPWTQIDDVFYESRGSVWALIHLLKAVEYDFAKVLEKKNALISLRQIIRELEATQETVWSPFILNGSGFGLFANHSLVMASYISRANAAIIDLRKLLSQG